MTASTAGGRRRATHLDRNAPGDRDRARTLLAEAVAMYNRIGMPMLVELVETWVAKGAAKT